MATNNVRRNSGNSLTNSSPSQCLSLGGVCGGESDHFSMSCVSWSMGPGNNSCKCECLSDPRIGAGSTYKRGGKVQRGGSVRKLQRGGRPTPKKTRRPVRSKSQRRMRRGGQCRNCG